MAKPHLLSRRGALGLPDRPCTGLDREIRAEIAARVDFRHVLAHLTFAGRATCGDAAPFWARGEIVRWLGGFCDDDLDDLADELVLEAIKTQERLAAKDAGVFF